MEVGTGAAVFMAKAQFPKQRVESRQLGAQLADGRIGSPIWRASVPTLQSLPPVCPLLLRLVWSAQGVLWASVYQSVEWVPAAYASDLHLRGVAKSIG